jgi:hypothetical protein
MAVPGSGQLNMLKLAREKVYDDYNSSSAITAPISMYDLVNGGSTNGSGNAYETTNTNSSSFPNTSTPHAFSEWYSYDHDAAPATPNHWGTWAPSVTDLDWDDNGTDSIGHATKDAACSSTNTIPGNNCTYMGWTGTLGNGTTLYWRQVCTFTNAMDANNRWIKIDFVYGTSVGCVTAYTGNAVGYVMQVSDSGVVSNFQACDSLTAYTSSVMGVFNATCPVNGSVNTLNQTYYHDGSGTYPTAGDTCYSDSAGNNPLAAGYYVLGNSTSGAGNRNYIFMDQSDGVVESGYPQSC